MPPPPGDCEENLPGASPGTKQMHPSTFSTCTSLVGLGVEWAMQDPLDRADHYRKEAVKCHELAKCVQPAFLGDFYRHMAVRYMFMAEDVVKDARAYAARRATVARSRA
jgi:hypothetical protein